MQKQTVGSQLLDKINRSLITNDQGPDTREVTLEYGKDFMQKLNDIVKSKEYEDWKHIWIKVLGKKDIASENIVRFIFFCSQEEPPMELHCMCFHYDRKIHELTLNWCLPQSMKIAKAMMEYSDGFDPLYVASCFRYVNLLNNRKATL